MAEEGERSLRKKRYSAIEIDIYSGFVLHFQTDLAGGPRKNVTCPFSIEPKLTELKIREVLLASCTKMLTKFSEAPSQIFQVGN